VFDGVGGEVGSATGLPFEIEESECWAHIVYGPARRRQQEYRFSGATTGAWPGVQPFGGWKGSGSTGKAGGGPYYVTQYLREQSRTVIEE
jgi:hypothetical protein